MDGLRAADEDTKWDISFWAFGLVMMSTAIIEYFGWAGGFFCFGFIIWAAGNHGLDNPKDRT
jgi:hypothetical protein